MVNIVIGFEGQKHKSIYMIVCCLFVTKGKPFGTPDASAFFRVIHDHDVAGMFTAPTALRAISKADPDGVHCSKYDMKK